jgi:hypothetical protein
VDRPLWVFAILLTVLIAGACGQLRAEPSKAGIVGLGATTCRQFNEDVRSNPSIRRDYLAWAQGFMSGILLGRPPGVDEGLDLNPATFDLADQLHFLEDHCDQNTSVNFADAVEALYNRLRREGKTWLGDHHRTRRFKSAFRILVWCATSHRLFPPISPRRLARLLSLPSQGSRMRARLQRAQRR